MSPPKSEELRLRILQTARSLVQEVGLKDLSMRKVANGAVCPDTSVYLHFDSKDSLIEAVNEEFGLGIGLRIKAFRVAMGKPLASVARMSSLSEEYLAEVERNTNIARNTDSLHHLIQALGIDYGWLFGPREQARGGNWEVGFSLFLDPGDASSEDISEIYSAISDLQRALGGIGVSIRDSDEKVYRVEGERV